MRRIVLRQLPIQIGTASLDGQEKKAEEVQERQRGINAHIGAGAADFLHAKRFIGGAEAGCEDKESLVGGAEVTSEEVREHSSGRI